MLHYYSKMVHWDVFIDVVYIPTNDNYIDVLWYSSSEIKGFCIEEKKRREENEILT